MDLPQQVIGHHGGCTRGDTGKVARIAVLVIR
jgi:hypothetical protein